MLARVIDASCRHCFDAWERRGVGDEEREGMGGLPPAGGGDGGSAAYRALNK